MEDKRRKNIELRMKLIDLGGKEFEKMKDRLELEDTEEIVEAFILGFASGVLETNKRLSKVESEETGE